MIKFIAAIDIKHGMANDHGIPWQGKLPTDVAYFRNKTNNSSVLMGYATYKELSKPFPNRQNYVATSSGEVLRTGFERVNDARKFIGDALQDIWVIGGAGLFASTIDLADELHLTQLDTDFRCTKFFPEFEHDFVLSDHTEPKVENDITYQFQVWKRPAN